MRLLLIILAALHFCPTLARAADVHCGASATGSGNGSDWNNQCDLDTVTFVRGNVYYVADGTYTGRTYSVTANGSLITIRKATEASHGTATGWSSAFGDGVATFTGAQTFTTDDWTWTGVTRTGIRSGHGFRIDYGSDCITVGVAFTTAADDITLDYFECEGSNDFNPSGDPDDGSNDRGVSIKCSSGCAQRSDNIYIGHAWVHKQGESTIHATSPGSLTIEYSVIEENDSTALQHAGGVIIQNSQSGTFTFRYNIMDDIEGTAFIETPTGGHDPCPGSPAGTWLIYGNYFGRKASSVRETSGAGTVYIFDFYLDTLIFHHNIVTTNSSSGFVGADTSGESGGCIATFEARNNIFYDIDADQGLSCGNVTSCTRDSNAFFSEPAVGTNTYSSTGNPMVDQDNWDYSITSGVASAMTAGATLSIPYNVDRDGVTRGIDGKWDRGALEFNEGGGPAPDPPGTPLDFPATINFPVSIP